MRRLLAALQEDQWVAVDNSGGVVAQQIGTAAGLPLSGLIAAIALSGVTRRIRSRLEVEGLVVYIDPSEARSEFGDELLDWPVSHVWSEIGIVDDEAYMYVGKPSSMVYAATKTAEIAFEEYRRAGLELHVKKCKTCVVMSWNGEGRGW